MDFYAVRLQRGFLIVITADTHCGLSFWWTSSTVAIQIVDTGS